MLTRRNFISSLAATAVFGLAACSNQTQQATPTTAEAQTTATTAEASTSQVAAASGYKLGQVPNTLAADEEALVANVAPKFQQLEYADAQTGLSVTYNLFLPANYDANGSYPMVVFIADSSLAGAEAAASLTQGRGALVWASDEWQAVYPTVVLVPTYPEVILDDHSGYTTTEYVELTARLIEAVAAERAVDPKRIYGTGQSMGCMTTLILATQHPSLYAACMFVDGQWDVSTLTPLEDQKFIYFAAEDDESAWAGLQEVRTMFDADNKEYAYAQWDGTWEPDQLSAAAESLFAEGRNANFVSWATGTIDASTGGMGAMMGGGNGGPGGTGGRGGANAPSDDASSNASATSSEAATASAEGSAPQGGGAAGGAAGGAGGMGSAAYHMASFDYAYNCVAAEEWLIQQ